MKWFRMEEIWIIGVGRFGQLAFERLSESGKKQRFVLVDPLEENLLHCKGPTTKHVVSDGIKYIEKHLKNFHKPDWIIPALPIHLAAEWFLLHLGPSRLGRIDLPTQLDLLVPNPIRGPEGNLYVSHADFRCPEDCDEPRDICTITRKTRKRNMHELLGDLDVDPFTALCMQSHQLGPGIGGYRSEQLIKFMEKVDQTRGAILLSTACRCHGVITGLDRKI